MYVCMYVYMLRQEAVFRALKPGVTWVDMHKTAERAILQTLKQGGLVTGDVARPHPRGSARAAGVSAARNALRGNVDRSTRWSRSGSAQSSCRAALGTSSGPGPPRRADRGADASPRLASPRHTPDRLSFLR